MDKVASRAIVWTTTGTPMSGYISCVVLDEGRRLYLGNDPVYFIQGVCEQTIGDIDHFNGPSQLEVQS